MSRNRISARRRRDFLKATGAVGAVGLAGCLGGEDDGDGGDGGGGDGGDGGGSGDGGDGGDGDGGEQDAEETLVLGTAAEVSANFAMFSGLGGVVNENTDDVYLDVRPSDSMAANVGRLQRDEIDVGLIENTTAHDVAEGNEPFQDVDIDLRMLVHGSTSDWFLFSGDESITSFDDIGPDTRVAPGPAGSRVTEMVRRVLEIGDVEYEERNVGYGDMGAAIAEGRVDVALASNMNVLIDPVTPGWVQEIKGTVDAHIIGMSEEHFQAVNDEPGMHSFEFEPADPDGWAHVSDPVRSMSQVTWMYGTADTSEDAVSNMLETMYENRDGMDEYHDLLGFYANDDHWANEPHEGFDLHPAAQSFFEENDLL